MADAAMADVRRRRLLLAPALVHLSCAVVPAWASADEALAERHIKAAYLHRFAGYVEWPESAFSRPDVAFSIGVWGNDAMAEDLTRLVHSRTIDGHPVEVRRVRDGESLGGLHTLFVNRDRGARLAELAIGPQLRGILVVTDAPTGLRSGGVINFVPGGGLIRFEVSVAAAERNGLRLSSRLLALAVNAPERGR